MAPPHGAPATKPADPALYLKDLEAKKTLLRFLGPDARLHGRREHQRARAEGILRDTHLTDRCILEGNDENKLGFRSRKMSRESFSDLDLTT